MARPLRRLAWPALVIALAAALVAGCGGGGDGGGEDRAQGLSPAELLRQSADAAQQAGPFRIALDVTGNIDLTDPSAVPGGNLLNGPLDISGEGPVDPPDKASIDATIKLGGLPLQINLTRVGDEVFVGALGQDFRVGLPPEQVALLDLGSLYPTLVDWTTDPAEGGREDVDGTETVKVTGQVDAATALGDLAPVLGGDAPTPAAGPPGASPGHGRVLDRHRGPAAAADPPGAERVRRPRRGRRPGGRRPDREPLRVGPAG